MANLKKEVMSLISRFDAAQEAFSANSVEVKELRKKHKKELKKARAEAKAAQIEVEALKAELAILRSGAPAKKTAAKPAAKRSPGRPKKAASTTAAKPAAKRSPGRPKKDATAAAAKPAAKRSPGRPKKATAAAKPAATGAKRGPGRPRTKPATPVSPLVAIPGFGPALAKHFEAAGVKTPAAVAKLSNSKMSAILQNCGRRYQNADSARMQAYRDAAASLQK